MAWTLYTECEQGAVVDALEANLIERKADNPDQFPKPVEDSAKRAIKAVDSILNGSKLFGDDKVAVNVNGHVAENEGDASSIGIHIHNMTAATKRRDESSSFEPETDPDSEGNPR